jgi:LmbE family N-acetylglucosaminyl deacetylase
LRYRLEGRHAPLTGAALAADLDTLIALVRPTDLFTHAGFDGHPDHAEVGRQVEAALARTRLRGTLHLMLIHPDGTARCLRSAAGEWLGPAAVADDPLARLDRDHREP